MLLSGAVPLPVQAQNLETYTFTVNGLLPDGNAAGLSDVRNLSSAIATITSLNVRLKIAGEFNGDIYAYLRHVTGNSTNYCVLLNRPGKTAVDRYGYSDTGLEVMFQTGAPNGDVHLYQSFSTPTYGSPLTGTWEPDGRIVDPTSVTDASSRSTSLTNFNGFNAAGEWTLFLADVESGGTNMLSEWSLEIAGAAYPTIAWPSPADIVYGTALSTSNLNATANCNSTNLPGTFAYTPSSGTILNAGSGQRISVTFTPSNPSSFLPVSTSVTINVQQAPLTITANSTNKVYGAALPTLTASYRGFVNGDTSASLGSAATLATAATAASPVGTYAITASGATGTNYSITYVTGVLTVYTLNHPPVLAFITNAIIQPDGWCHFTVTASDPDGDQLSVSLDPGAPVGAVIVNRSFGTRGGNTGPVNSTNVSFKWLPTRAYASTTNFITIRVTDNGWPALSTSQTFSVVVQDFLETSIGSTNMERGQRVAVPISLASSDGVTNLALSIPWPASQFTNPVLTATAEGIASASLEDQITNLLISMQMSPGQILQGTQQIAQLSFLAISNQHSAFVPLPIEIVSGVKPDASSYINTISHAGTVAVIQTEPLLLANFSTNQARGLTLFGRVGVAYQIQYSTSMGLAGSWHPLLNYTQTNGVMTVGMDSTEPMIFYRLFQQE